LAESLRLEQDADLVKAQRVKREPPIVAQRVPRADAELGRRGPSRLNDQNEPPFEVMLGVLAFACKRLSPQAHLEIRASNVWQDDIVDAPNVSDVQLIRLGFALEGKLVSPPPACVVHRKGLDGLRSLASARLKRGRHSFDLES
jgi:hypothetical protein